MEIIKENKDALNAVLKVKLGQSDYQNKVDSAIKEYQKKVQMPGFRPGKVPAGMVKKMYGKSILAEEVNKLLNESLYKYIQDNNIEVLGNPLPSVNDKVDFDNQTEFEFNYDLGLAPQFEVKLNSNEAFNYYKIVADAATVDKYMNDVAKRYGKIIHPEAVEKDDLVNGDLVELDTDGNIISGGIFRNASVFLERIKEENALNKFLGLKKEDKVVLKFSEIGDEASAYIYSLSGGPAEKNGKVDFQFTVKDVSRLVAADFNQELFDKIYGENVVTSAEEFKQKLKEDIEKSFVNESERKLREDIVKRLMDKIKIELPDAFLKRWIMAVNEKPITTEQIEKDYDSYASQLKWQLIENKIYKDYNIKVSDEDAVAYTKELIKKQFAQYGRADISDAELNETALKVLSDEKEGKRVYDQMYDDRLMSVFKEKFTINNKEINHEEFVKLEK